MELLDAVLAFALTLAALATVVTVIMEIVLRSVLMRKKNLVEVMRLLNGELPKGTLGLSEQERWEFFTKTVENPAEGVSKHIPKVLGEGDSAAAAMDKVDWRCLKNGVYDKVSTEHLLRRLSELPSVTQLCAEANDKIKQEFYRLAGKYEEFGSAVSASFKRRSQFWSIVFGMILAVVANVDGIRIFEAYQASTDLAQTVVARQDQIGEAYGMTDDRRRAILAQETVVEQAKAALAAARKKSGDDSPEAKAALEKLDEENDKLASLTDPAELQRIALDAQKQVESLIAMGVPIGAQKQVESLIAMGVPIGAEYFPHCRIFGRHDLSTTCSGPGWPSGVGDGLWPERFAFMGHVLLWLVPVVITGMLHVLLWLVPVVITGMLIGLGAPFWFDVAKRLSEVRQMFGASGSDSTRLAARDADGDPDKRDAIATRVVDDAASNAAAALK
jgi:hypothetical protein